MNPNTDHTKSLDGPTDADRLELLEASRNASPSWTSPSRRPSG